MNGKELKRLAGLVSSQNACRYALANGWQRVEYGDGGIALFDRPDSELDQLIIPLHPTGPDYSRRIVDVVMNLSEVENRPAEEVVNDLLMPGADVIRYRIISPDTDKGDVSLEDGLRILAGARRSLLAAACSVAAPVKHHPRMSHAEATQFLDACRLRQTERGSFTVAIACPLNVEESLFDAHEPFTRRATEFLMRSANRLVKSIESGKVDSIYEEQSDAPTISTNFCQALLQMQPEGERSRLAISVTWASTHPREAGPEIPRELTFQHDYFPIVEDIYKKLIPSHEPSSSLFFGTVDTLNGDVNADGQVQGDTRLLIAYEEEMVKARVDLNARDYQTAIQAHAKSQFVRFEGILHLGRRTHRITDVTGFEIMSAQ